MLALNQRSSAQPNDKYNRFVILTMKANVKSYLDEKNVVSAHNVFTKLVNMAVLPVMTYSGGIWGLQEYKLLKTVLNKAGRFLLGLPPNVPNVGPQRETGWNSVICHTR